MVRESARHREGSASLPLFDGPGQHVVSVTGPHACNQDGHRVRCRRSPTPLLVMPDDTPAHPYQTSVDIGALAPKAQSTVFPWREPKDLLDKTIDQVRAFLRSHQPVTAGR